MSIIDEVNEKRREISSDGYAMQNSAFVSLYDKKEVAIRSEFQRFYRWDSIQKTNLIESILLGINIPRGQGKKSLSPKSKCSNRKSLKPKQLLTAPRPAHKSSFRDTF
jgi:uncharacterized protein with ParB-like and HNH nuclease domain